MARDCLDAQSSGLGQHDIPHRPVALSICLSCRDDREITNDGVRGGARLAQAVLQTVNRNAVLDIRGVHCLSQCKRSCTLALSGPDRFTYIFGDLDPTRHAHDVVELATLYIHSPDGFLARNNRPQSMRANVLGRVPPLGWSGAAVETIPLIPSTLKEPR